MNCYSDYTSFTSPSLETRLLTLYIPLLSRCYNGSMWKKLPLYLIILGLVLNAFLFVQPIPAEAAPNAAVTTQDLLNLVNGLRTGRGLTALTINSTLMSTAQSTAQTMADGNLTWHIGGTSDRVAAAGYGGGSTVWATENFATGSDSLSIEAIQAMWADASHMIPMANPIYCDLGAGVATASDGTIYYVVHAAYTSSRYCGEYVSPNGQTLPTIQAATAAAGGPTQESIPTDIAESQWIAPLMTVTPNANSELIHDVLNGHTMWSIAIAYETKMDFIKELNNWPYDDVYVGQKLYIPTPEYWALTPTVTPTATEAPIDPAIMATQSDSTPSPTITETAEATPTPNPIVGVIEENEPTAPDQSDPITTLLIVVLVGAVLVMGISLWQPWKTKIQPIQEPEDPLKTRVE